MLASDGNRSNRQNGRDLGSVDQRCLGQIRWQLKPGICEESIVLVIVEWLPFNVKKVFIRQENERADVEDTAVRER